MKVSHIFLVFLASVVFLLNASFVLAINSNEASVIVNWDKEKYYQGDIVPARITFISNFSQPLDIYYVGINFDWMEKDNFQGIDLSSNPVTVPSFGSHSFDLMVFHIPTTINIGLHDYFVGIDGSYDGSDGSLPIGFSWDSPIFALQISDTLEKTFLALNTQVVDKINQANESTYDSPEANSLLSQALEAKNAANIFAVNDQFGDAITSLNQASGYLDLIDEEEQLFDQQQANQNQVILLVSIGVIATILIVIIFIVLNKRKKNLKEIDLPTKSLTNS